MKTIAFTAAAVVALGFLAGIADLANAKGNGGAEERKALKAAIAEARAKNAADAERQSTQDRGFFSTLFGSDESEEERMIEQKKSAPATN